LNFYYEVYDEIKTLKCKIENIEKKNEDLEKDSKRYRDKIEKTDDKDAITKFMVII
jgi:hypothetical protein